MSFRSGLDGPLSFANSHDNFYANALVRAEEVGEAVKLLRCSELRRTSKVGRLATRQHFRWCESW